MHQLYPGSYCPTGGTWALHDSVLSYVQVLHCKRCGKIWSVWGGVRKGSDWGHLWCLMQRNANSHSFLLPADEDWAQTVAKTEPRQSSTLLRHHSLLHTDMGILQWGLEFCIQCTWSWMFPQLHNRVSTFWFMTNGALLQRDSLI